MALINCKRGITYEILCDVEEMQVVGRLISQIIVKSAGEIDGVRPMCRL